MRSDIKTKDRTCFFELGSVSASMSAQRALAAAAIPSEVIKHEGISRSRGCVYGIEFSCVQANNVRAVLGAANIKIKGSGGS